MLLIVIEILIQENEGGDAEGNEKDKKNGKEKPLLPD